MTLDHWRNQIVCMDCLEGMKKLEDGCVDLVLTSPPFKEEDVNGDYWNLYQKWFSEIKRVTAKVICIIHSATKINRLIEAYPPKRLMIWGKPFSKYSWRYNPILVYQISDEYSVNKRIWTDFISARLIYPHSKTKKHKYQDPLNLYRIIINMFKECHLILDPFMGSGTTAVACKQLGRDFIGFEISPEYCAIAEQRLAQEELFAGK